MENIANDGGEEIDTINTIVVMDGVIDVVGRSRGFVGL